MPPPKSGKSQYSESEAAEELGLGVMQLRAVIRSHVTNHDEELRNMPATAFQASDLVILRMLMSEGQARLLES